MPRPTGSRNKGFEQKREKLLVELTDFALNSDVRYPSLRVLAQRVSVSEPTLRHYFDDRQGVIREILTDISRRGQVIWDVTAAPAESPPSAFDQYFKLSEIGMVHGGFVRTHVFGIIEGLADPEIGKVYAELILEPSLQAVEKKLRLSGGEHLSPVELRVAALSAFSPLFFISLHQDILGTQNMKSLPATEMMKTMKDWIGRSTSA